MASRFLRRSQLNAANTILRQLKEVLELANTDQPRIPEAADDDDEVIVDEDEQQRQRLFDALTAATRASLVKAAMEFEDFSAALKYDFGLADNSDALQRAFEVFDADVINCKARKIVHVCVCVCVCVFKFYSPTTPRRRPPTCHARAAMA